MGRKPSLTVEERRMRQRERDEKKKSDPQKLAKKREQDRQRQRERYQQAKQAAHDPLTLLADMATQAQLLEEIGDDDDGGGLAGENGGALVSIPECPELGMGTFGDDGVFIELHGDGEGFNLAGIHANSRNPC